MSNYMRREAAAEYIGISPRCLSDWQKRGVVPYVKVSRKVVLFKQEDIDAALDAMKTTTSDEEPGRDNP